MAHAHTRTVESVKQDHSVRYTHPFTWPDVSRNLALAFRDRGRRRVWRQPREDALRCAKAAAPALVGEPLSTVVHVSEGPAQQVRLGFLSGVGGRKEPFARVEQRGQHRWRRTALEADTA
eukprot:scaffold113055_cov34-Tisochrysis_lutea.AAC.1